MPDDDRNNTNAAHETDQDTPQDTSRSGTDERERAAGRQGGSRSAQGVPRESSTRQSPGGRSGR